MSLRESALRIADKLRSIPSQPGIDMRVHALSIVVRNWPSGRPGDGEPVDTVTTVGPVPVEEISMRESASSGGLLQRGDIRVGPITPRYSASSIFPAGGFLDSDLRPAIPPGTKGKEVIYQITGPLAGDYKVIDLKSDRPLRRILLLRRSNRTP